MSASVTMPKVYKEIVDFLAAGTTSQGFISFQLSDKAQERVANLIQQAKKGLTGDEKKVRPLLGAKASDDARQSKH